MIGDRRGVKGGAIAMLAVLLLASPAAAQPKAVVVGVMCDRSGATQNVGAAMCAGSLDYAALINARGGAEGRLIRPIEVDIESKLPVALEAYERFKKEGATSVLLYGMPVTLALARKLEDDRIPGTAPGFGPGASVDARRFPYVFPITATYWSQAAGAVKFAKDRLGTLKGKRIAYLFSDNAGGREPLALLQELAKTEEFELRPYAVPLPGLDFAGPATDIARTSRADFVITHLFGRSPSASLRDLRRVGYPLAKVIALAWGGGESDIEGGGADGYNTIQIAGVGTDYQLHKDIAEMYRRQNKPAPKEMATTVYYNRGLFHMVMHVAAIRNALNLKGAAGTLTGEDVKGAFEKLPTMSLGGLMPPLALSATDHEGGGWVKVVTVRSGKLDGASEWFRAYPETIKRLVEADAGKR